MTAPLRGWFLPGSFYPTRARHTYEACTEAEAQGFKTWPAAAQ
jgi:hypothetical protein